MLGPVSRANKLNLMEVIADLLRIEISYRSKIIEGMTRGDTISGLGHHMRNELNIGSS